MNEILPDIRGLNFYQFLTIAGLILIVATLLYSNNMEEAARKKVFEFAEFSAKINFEAENDSVAFKNASEDEKQLIINKHKYYENRFNTLAVSMIAQARTFEKSNLIKIYGCSFGLLISCIGGVLWFIRIQRPTDKVLANQSKLLRKNRR